MTLDEMRNELNETFELFPKSASAIKDLLPPPAAITRTIKQKTTMPFEPLHNVKDVYVRSNELYKEFSISFGPVGASKNTTDKQMEDWADDYLSYYLQNKNERKYIEIVEANTTKIKFRFAVEKWLYDNFNGHTPYYSPVATLCFEFKVEVPLFFRDNTNWINSFVCTRFEYFMSTRKNKLLNTNFSFMKIVDPSMFEYKIDYRLGYKGGIRAALRHTVIMGALAIYTSVFFKKKINSTQEKSIKASASRFSDTDNLNKFLRNLK